MNDINVNDGGGFYDINGMFDSLIVDVDNQLKLLFSGERIAFCGGMVGMIQKITAMQNGVNKEISELKEQIRQLEKEKGEERIVAGPFCDTLQGALGGRG